MADTIEGYLTELRGALAGADPALVQDAVYDAGEHLREAAAEGGDTPDAIAAAIEAYGPPAEVAAAYADREATVAEALRKPAPERRETVLGRFFGVLADSAAWGALFYMLLSLVTGVIYFTIVVTGLSALPGLMLLIIGIPLALLFIAVVRAVSFAEGRIVEGLLGERMPRRPRTSPAASSGARPGFWATILSWFTDYHTWTTMLYMVLQLVLGTVYFTIAVIGLATAAALIAMPIVQWVFNVPVILLPSGFYQIQWWAVPFIWLLAVLAFVCTLWVAKGIGFVHRAYAKALLVGRIDKTAGAPAAASQAGAAPAGAMPAAAPAVETGYVPPATDRTTTPMPVAASAAPSERTMPLPATVSAPTEPISAGLSGEEG